ncbi:MAG: glycogen synthase GlgA [Elusimicrobiota bacterium]
MKVAFAVSECVPFAKTGGLADVAGALVKALKKRKADVCLVMPKYKNIDVEKFKLKPLINSLLIPIGGGLQVANVWVGKLDRTINVYFIENEQYFGREELYRTAAGGDYADNAERFIFFSRAVLETLKAVDFQPDVLHCHDWQTGLIPAYLRTIYLLDGFYRHTASVFTIHNIAFQGFFPPEVMSTAGFAWFDFTPDKLEYYGQVNFMKAAITFANVITTVSPTYAKEIQESHELGRGMENVLGGRSEDLYGIVNGIDLAEWNPEKDEYLPKNYTVKSLENKVECKQALFEELGWPVDLTIPVLGMVSRLDPLKGFDLLAQAVHTLMQREIRLVILGRGDSMYEAALTKMAEKFPDRIAVKLDFNEPMAHKIYAGVDMFLMPSRFEPCGLAQMIAMRYGTVPVVHTTGGLADTVVDYSPETKKGNGIAFTEYNCDAFLAAIDRGIALYNDKEQWGKILKNAMAGNFSWEKSVRKYQELYKLAIQKREAFNP